MGDTNVQLRGTAETGGDAIDISHSIAKVGVAGSNRVVRATRNSRSAPHCPAGGGATREG